MFKYWNVIDTDHPDIMLMSVSTVNYVTASNKAHELRIEHPKRMYSVIRTDVLEPYKEVEK